MPYKNIEDRKKYYKEYWIKNKEKLTKQKKQYNINNKEKVAQCKRNWAKNNKEKIKKYMEKWYIEHKDYCAKRSKKYHQEHKEQIKENRKIYYKENREQFLKYAKKNREENKEHFKKYLKSYLKTENGKAAAQRGRTKRQARERTIINTLTSQEWLDILKQYDYKCAYCGCKFDENNPPTRDHVIPISKGGDNTKENVVPACQSCNSKKRDKWAEGD